MEIIIGGVLVFLAWVWAHIGLLCLLIFSVWAFAWFCKLGENVSRMASDLSEIRSATENMSEKLERIENTLEQIESNTDRLPQIAPWEPGGIANPL